MSVQDISANLKLLTGYARSITDVCRGSAVNRTQFHRYLAGQTVPTMRNLRRLCDYFGVEEHEMLMEHDSFRALIRVRPPRIGLTEDPFSAIQGRIGAGDPPGRVAMGYYNLLFCPDPGSALFYRALMRLDPAPQGVIIKLVERYPRPSLSMPRRLTYEGTGFVRHGKLYSLMQEVRHRRSTWFTVLSIGDFARPSMLSGVAIGSEPEGNASIQTHPVVWIHLGARPDLRHELRRCGYFRRDEIELLPEVEQMLLRGHTR